MRKPTFTIATDYSNTLTRNGWSDEGRIGQEIGDWEHPQLSHYRNVFVADYESTIDAVVCESWDQLEHTGSYGIQWLEVVESEHEMPYRWEEVEDLLDALIYAEDNLVLIGIPFADDYQFHGKNKANKKRRNDALIKRLNLVEKQDKDAQDAWEYKQRRREREAEWKKKKEAMKAAREANND